jgi:hypothetical protein
LFHVKHARTRFRHQRLLRQTGQEQLGVETVDLCQQALKRSTVEFCGWIVDQ